MDSEKENPLIILEVLFIIKRTEYSSSDMVNEMKFPLNYVVEESVFL